MAESKLIQANKQIKEKTLHSFKKIEDTVVNDYTKIEDTFVDQYLTHDGETIEEVKIRLRKQSEVTYEKK